MVGRKYDYKARRKFFFLEQVKELFCTNTVVLHHCDYITPGVKSHLYPQV